MLRCVSLPPQASKRTDYAGCRASALPLVEKDKHCFGALHVHMCGLFGQSHGAQPFCLCYIKTDAETMAAAFLRPHSATKCLKM